MKKPKFRLTGEAKEALKNYYDAAHELCVAQADFAKATQKNLKSKIEDKTVFLSIIQQVRLPSVQIHVRTVEEIEQLEGKTYRELTMSQHLPDAKKIYSNSTDQTRTMAAFMLLCPVRTDHWPEGIADWMQQRFPVPRNPVQEASDKEETTWWAQVDPANRKARGRWKR